jgi:hypothetical protein
MQMRIKLFHIPVAALLAVLSVGLGCAGARKPAAVLPAFKGAPPIQASRAQATPPRTPTNPSRHSSLEAGVKPVESKSDPVAELVTKAGKEYLAGEGTMPATKTRPRSTMIVPPRSD